MRALLLCALAALAGPPGCGYRLVDPAVGAGRTIVVPTSVNATRWRGAEALLTGALRRDLQRQLDLRLGAGPGDLLLETEIVEGVRSAPVQERGGGAALGALRLQVAWELKDAAGTVLGHGSLARSLEFLPADEETAYDALAEILDSMAEHVVIEVGVSLAGFGRSPEQEPAPDR